jgi:4-aminobutyrate aminotransferase
VRSTDVQIPPRAYYEALRRACDRHGALLILDEIPIGLGRTGTMFAFEHYGIVPDMVVLGKGLGGGVFPMAALIAREGLDIAAQRALGHYTHEKSSVGCAAALATLDVIEDEGLVANARARGAQLLAGLRSIAADHPAVGDVRGLGLMVALEFVRPGEGDGREPDPGLTKRVLAEALARKLIVLSAGSYGNVARIIPPLVTTEREVDRALGILRESIEAATA